MVSLEANTTTSGGSKRFVALIALIVASVAFVVLSMQSCAGSEYASLLSEQRVLSQRLSKYADRAVIGQDPAAFANLKESQDLFERNFNRLKNGDPETGMDPVPPEVVSEFGRMGKAWEDYGRNISVVIAHESTVEDMHGIVKNINDRSPQLVALSDEIATLMANQGASPDQVYVATRQLMLAQRMVSNVNRVVEGGEGSVTAADRFGRDAALFGRVVNGMLDGAQGMGVQRVQDQAIRAKLVTANELFDVIAAQVAAVLERTPEMYRVSEAAFEAAKRADALLQSITDFETAYLSHMGNRKLTFGAGSLFVGLALVVLMAIALPGGRTLTSARHIPA